MFTIFITSLLIVAVVMAVRKIIRDKKAGKGGCGGNCSACIFPCQKQERSKKK